MWYTGASVVQHVHRVIQKGTQASGRTAASVGREAGGERKDVTTSP